MRIAHNGKTHLAIALGRQAIRDGHRVRFYNLLDLVNRLEQEKLAGQGGRTAETLARTDPGSFHYPSEGGTV
jgi:DNA replication protein DnaC